MAATNLFKNGGEAEAKVVGGAGTVFGVRSKVGGVKSGVLELVGRVRGDTYGGWERLERVWEVGALAGVAMWLFVVAAVVVLVREGVFAAVGLAGGKSEVFVRVAQWLVGAVFGWVEPGAVAVLAWTLWGVAGALSARGAGKGGTFASVLVALILLEVILAVAKCGVALLENPWVYYAADVVCGWYAAAQVGIATELVVFWFQGTSWACFVVSVIAGVHCARIVGLCDVSELVLLAVMAAGGLACRGRAVEAVAGVILGGGAVSGASLGVAEPGLYALSRRLGFDLSNAPLEELRCVWRMAPAEEGFGRVRMRALVGDRRFALVAADLALAAGWTTAQESRFGQAVLSNVAMSEYVRSVLGADVSVVPEERHSSTGLATLLEALAGLSWASSGVDGVEVAEVVRRVAAFRGVTMV